MEYTLADRLYEWLEEASEKEAYATVGPLGSALATSVGLVRRENQDRLLIASYSSATAPRESFLTFAVCDGMGGMSEGSDCARLALSTFLGSLVAYRGTPFRNRAVSAILDANSRILERYHGGGGTTLSAVIFNDRDGSLAVHVGDSRIYEFSHPSTFEQKTIDDTIEGALARLKREPGHRVEDNGISAGKLAQFVGMGEGLNPHIFRLKNLFRDTGFLITSDGAHLVPEQVLRTLVLNSDGPSSLVERLLSISLWLGGEDNASAITGRRDRK